MTDSNNPPDLKKIAEVNPHLAHILRMQDRQANLKLEDGEIRHTKFDGEWAPAQWHAKDNAWYSCGSEGGEASIDLDDIGPRIINYDEQLRLQQILQEVVDTCDESTTHEHDPTAHWVQEQIEPLIEMLQAKGGPTIEVKSDDVP